MSSITVQIKKKTFNDFVVWISEKEPIFSDQYFNGNSIVKWPWIYET